MKRNKNGTFAKGNPGGPGNPLAKRINQLRADLIGAVTRKDMKEIIKALSDKAKDGDVIAAREIFNRILGRPIEQDIIERLETLEKKITGK